MKRLTTNPGTDVSVAAAPLVKNLATVNVSRSSAAATSNVFADGTCAFYISTDQALRIDFAADPTTTNGLYLAAGTYFFANINAASVRYIAVSTTANVTIIEMAYWSPTS